MFGRVVELLRSSGLMGGLDWGTLYTKYGDVVVEAEAVEEETRRLMADDGVTRQRSISEYILRGDERHLNIRAFLPRMKQRAYERHGGNCLMCDEVFRFDDMEADHITPWSEGGHTDDDKCQMLCRQRNRRKGAR